MSVKLTHEDLAKLQSKELANAIRKLHAGKTLTAAERALLARATDEETGAPAAEGFVKTWAELAEACHVDRRTLQNVRDRFAAEIKKRGKELVRADGRYVVAAWITFLDEKGVRSRGVNNTGGDITTERELRLEREKFQLEKAKYELKCAKDQTVPIAHVEAALGHMLARFRQALDSLPGRIAGGIEEADRAELLTLLARAEKEKLSYKRLRALIESGKARAFTDIHARREFVTSEVDSVRRLLIKCEYLQADPTADAED